MQLRATVDNSAVIYMAAKQYNAAALAKLVSSNISLDSKDSAGLCTAAGRLAAEGDEKAVDLLRSFGVSEDYIAMGYDIAGNMDAAEKLRCEKGVTIHYLALGAGLSPKPRYALFLQKKFNLSPEWAVAGAAYAGNNLLVDKIISAFEFHDNYETLLSMASLAHLNGLIAAQKLTGKIQVELLAKLVDEPVLHTIANTLIKSKTARVMDYRRLLIMREASDNPSSIVKSYTRVNLRDPAVQKHSPADIVRAMDVSGFCDTDALLTYELAFVNNRKLLDSLDAAARKIAAEFVTTMPGIETPFVSPSFDNFTRCYQRALKLQAVMQACHFDFDQAQAFVMHKKVREALHLILDMSLDRSKFPPEGILMAMLKSAAGITQQQAQDMAGKYLLWSARFVIDARLQRYYRENYSLFPSIFAPAEHTERSESLRQGMASPADSSRVNQLLMLQFGLFNGTIKPNADPAKLKCEQPLNNADKRCNFYKVVTEIVESPRFKVFSGN